jgi:hypothetical protein
LYHVETLVRKYRRAKRLQAMDDANHQHRAQTVQVTYEPGSGLKALQRVKQGQ